MSEEQPLYRYFAQPKVNSYLSSIIGYELLLKVYTPHGWRIPDNFNLIPSRIIAQRLVEATEKLASKIGSVSVNLSSIQLINPLIREALLQAQANLRPVRLVIEMIEEKNGVSIHDHRVLAAVKDFTDQGMSFSIDDVDTGQNTWDNIQPLIPYATEIKYALQNRHEHLDDPVVRERLMLWAQRCKQLNIHLIVEGIEDPADVEWADTLKLDLRQGYHYGKPHLVRLKDSDPD
ncbi:C-di-GMP-specific phosphodiesterase [Paucilactobacillus vaccinostercus DSM 20634]|uniref:C-di-GMP-specific phosphodiesterase n=1 Tax=Paucilactobacillus vaccinostercus DSM 20634 TaxID=1423813 RepID=A0A0R2A094_9LACO|nr:EAL domain-containing protein [Paucilactobacillus vaccinostercus]KRM60397.1 C-di-GMP-specific phosphodiesterase [Paucilactobacillus vaccinostercus DSM 20634]